MIEQWSSVNKESDGLYAALARLLDEHEMDIQGFLGSDDVQEEYLEAVFYDMVEVLQYNSTSGILRRSADGARKQEAFPEYVHFTGHSVAYRFSVPGKWKPKCR